MDLYLIRHAEAVPLGEQGITSDEERPLTEPGQQTARAVGEGLRQRGVTFDKIVTSPLLRARQTAEGILRDWPAPAPELIVCDDLAPDGKPKRVGRFLRDVVGERVGLVGHMPQLGILTAWLIGSKKAQIDLDKGGVAYVACSSAKKARGTLLWLVPPEMLTS
jgi:phosphohistidine phosphatase